MKQKEGKVALAARAADILSYKANSVIRACSAIISTITKAEQHGYKNHTKQLIDELRELEVCAENMRIYLPKPDLDGMVEVVLEWFENSNDRLKAKFVTTEFDDLVVFHSTLGQNIRNHFNLWAFYDEKKEWHPDEASMEVIEEVWRIVKDEE